MIKYICDGCSKDLNMLLSKGSVSTFHTIHPSTGVGIGLGSSYVDLSPPLHFCEKCIKDELKVLEAKDRRWVPAAGGKRKKRK